MSSPKQIAANRSNASKSTGPRTDTGKRTSSLNALKHGLTAQDVVIPGEDRAAYDSFKELVLNAINPIGYLEDELSERLVAIYWRLRRIPRFEAEILKWASDRETKALIKVSRDKVADFVDVKREHPNFNIDLALQEFRKSQPDLDCAFGAAVNWALNNGVLMRLTDYEQRLCRQAETFMAQLVAMREARAAGPIMLENNTSAAGEGGEAKVLSTVIPLTPREAAE